MWRGEDSNLRRLRRQIYSLFPLTAREPLHPTCQDQVRFIPGGLIGARASFALALPIDSRSSAADTVCPTMLELRGAAEAE